MGKDEVILDQGKQRFVIPVNDITEISYGNDVHRRVGAAIGVAAVTLGIGLLMLLVKTKKHYVGIVWTESAAATTTAAVNCTGPSPTATPSTTTAKGGVVFKVGKRGLPWLYDGAGRHDWQAGGECRCRWERWEIEVADEWKDAFGNGEGAGRWEGNAALSENLTKCANYAGFPILRTARSSRLLTASRLALSSR